MDPRPLHEDTPPWRRHRLPLGDGHVLQVDEHGHPQGEPVLLLHGGPGSGCGPLLRRVFDPRRWRIVAVDQRGAGGSTPRGATAHNDSTRLLADLHAVRAALGIERWFVVGGSWGATLAVLHAADAPQAVSGLLLRGSFLARRADVEAFFADAPPALREGWAGFDTLGAASRAALAATWWHWERERSGLPPAAPADTPALVDRYRVQSHYLRHGAFLAEPLLATAARVPALPALLLHGRADRVCPPEGALALAAALPGARLQWVDGCGHDAAHPAMVDAVVRALHHWSHHGRFATAPEPAAA